MTVLSAVLRALQSIDAAGRVPIVAANIVVQTALIVLLALLLARTAARRSAAVRHAVWLGALVCIALATAVTVARPRARFSLVRLPSHRAHHVGDSPAPQSEPTTLAVAPAAAAAPSDGGSVALREPRRLRSFAAGAASTGHGTTFSFSGSPMAVAGGAILVAWLAGVLLLLARLGWGWRWMMRVRRTAHPPADPVPPAVLDAARRALGVADLPPVRESARVAGPVSVGLLRPVVVLPPGLAAALGPGQLRDVLVHECAHVRRRDQWVGLAQRLVAIALWPHPLVHVMNRELGRAREEVCDNHVLAGQPDRAADARGYAGALLALAESIRDARAAGVRQPRKRRPLTNVPLPAIGILGPGWPLEARVAGLLDARRTVMTRLTVKTRLLVVSCCCAVALAAAGSRPLGAAATEDDADRKAAAPAVSAARPGEGSGGAADKGSARDEGKDARSGPDTRPATRESERLAAQLDRVLPEVSFNGVAFGDVIDFLRDVSGSNIVADWKGLESAGVDRKTPVSYKAKNVRFRSALREILVLAGDAKHPVTYAARGNVLLISSRARASWFELNWMARATMGADETVMERALPEVRFEGVAFTEVIDFLRDVSGATINVHWKELEAAGVDRNTPVTLRLRDVPFGQALQLVLLTAAAGDNPPELTAEQGRILIRAARAASAAADPRDASAPKADRKLDGSGKPATSGGR